MTFENSRPGDATSAGDERRLETERSEVGGDSQLLLLLLLRGSQSERW